MEKTLEFIYSNTIELFIMIMIITSIIVLYYAPVVLLATFDGSVSVPTNVTQYVTMLGIEMETFKVLFPTTIIVLGLIILSKNKFRIFAGIALSLLFSSIFIEFSNKFQIAKIAASQFTNAYAAPMVGYYLYLMYSGIFLVLTVLIFFLDKNKLLLFFKNLKSKN